MGLEPTRALAQRILSPSPMPIRTYLHITIFLRREGMVPQPWFSYLRFLRLLIWFIFLPTYAEKFLSLFDKLGSRCTRSAISLHAGSYASTRNPPLFEPISQVSLPYFNNKGIGGVGFEPTHSLRSGLQPDAALQLDRPPLFLDDYFCFKGRVPPSKEHLIY